MKNLFAFYSFIILLLTTSNFVEAQDQKLIEINPEDQAYPIGNQPENERIAAFISVFDDTNVGNMHIYTTLDEKASADYFYLGKDITGTFDDLLSTKLKRRVRQTNGKIFAVHNIRGVNGEYYILRVPSKKGAQALKMYELQGTKLIETLTLADARCKANGTCWQTDSWIQDVDGDTRLDVIQKKAKLRDGKIIRESTTVYTQNRAGIFNKNNVVNIEEQDYMLEKLQ